MEPAGTHSDQRIETPRLLLRAMQAGNVADVFEYLGDPEVMRYRACFKVLQRIGMTWRRQILRCVREQADYYTITRQEHGQLAKA